MRDKIDALFDDLQSRGFAKGKTNQQFRDYMLAPGKQGYENRKQFFEDFKSQGMTDLETYEDFAGLLGMQAGTPERRTTPTYKPTAEEMAGFQGTINSAGRTVGNATQGYERKAKLMQKRQGLNVPGRNGLSGQYGRVELGQSNNLTPTEQHLNPETGELEQGYMTESGNEYDRRELADMEQREIERQRWEREHPEESLMSQIDDRIANLEDEIRKREDIEGIPAGLGTTLYQSGLGAPYHPNTQQQEYDDMRMALRDLQDAKTMLERNRQLHASSDFLGGVGIPFTKDWFNNWKNFGYGVWDALHDVSMYDFGVSEMSKAGTYMRIKNKIERGEELTDQETDIALAGMALAQAQQLADLPHGYTAGVTTTEMVPFMAQMAANPASGVGKAFARKAVRKFGRDGLKAVTARVAARVAGNVGEAAVLSNTWQAGKTAADIALRNTGGQFAYDENGNIIMGHYERGDNGEEYFVEGGKGVGQSIYEGEAASIIENFTELGFGGSINGMLSRAAGSRLGNKIGLGYISDLVGKVGTTPFARSMKHFMERTHWDGMIEEPLEEEYGIILNSLLTGDNQISDLWDSKQQADIFAGTMWFGGMMAVMNTAAYPFAKRAMKKKLNAADAEGEIAFGDEWAVMKAAIEELDDKKIADFLYGIKDDDKFSNEQKAALFGYAARLKQYQGANVGDMLMRMEGNLGQNEAAIKGAYYEGTDVDVPDEMKYIVDEATEAGERLAQYGKEFAAMVANGSADPAATLDYMMSHRDYYDDEQIAAAADYYQKNAKAQGVMDAALDRVDLEVERANAEVRANTHQGTGQVITAYSGDEAYYILGGDIVMPAGESAGTVALVGTGGAVVVKNAATGEVSVKSPGELSLASMQDAEELIQQNETVLREQLMQQADDDVTFGSPANEVFDMEDTVTLMDGEGGVIEGQVVGLPNAVDGVFVVQTNDGRALQMTADELNRRIVEHNGVEVVRAAAEPQPAENMEQKSVGEPTGTVAGNAETETEQSGIDSAGGEAGAEGAGANEPSATALSKIPVRTDAKGEPLKTKSGRPILDWHKASVEDAAAALVEQAGNMVMARDAASDMVKQSQAMKERISKQKPKGADPIELIESRKEIQRQIDEQQAIIKQWQDVNQLIQRWMREEQQRVEAEREAAKSEEQRQREAEEARIRKEKQDEIDRQRLREQIERDRERRNRPYQPIVDARKELTGDQEALSVLDDLEPRDLDEWVSSLLSPHSMLWQDASDAEVGLQTELGLKRADIQRFMQLLGTKESGAKPFGKVVLDIYESLPDAMKEQYTDEDVRRVVLDMFREMENSTQMMHLTEQHRIEEARQTAAENERRDREAEMEAWAEAYHLTPEEREAFEAYLQEPPTAVEEEVINQIIAAAAEPLPTENYEQQIGTSPAVGGEPDGGRVPAGVEGGEGQVQTAVEAAGNGVYAEGLAEGAEAGGGEPAVSGDNVAGGTSAVKPSGTVAVDREALTVLFDQIGADVTLAERMSDYEVEQLTAMVDEWDAVNSEYGEVIEQQKDALKSKNKAIRDAAQAIVNEAQSKANEAFEPIEMYVEELNAKYGIEKEEPFEGAIPTPKIDEPRMRAIRQALVDAYRSGDATAIAKAAKAVQDYVDEGLDDYVEYDGSNDNYDGDDPDTLADQYIVHVFQDRYLDDDEDQEYIRTGLKAGMRQIAPSEQVKPADLGKTSSPEEILAEEAKVDTNPTDAQKEAGNYQKGHIKIDGFDITIENPKGSVRRGTDASGKQWEQEMHNTYGYIRRTEGADDDHIDVFLSDNPSQSNKVFIVQQRVRVDGDWKFDELKVLLGFESAYQASNAYLSNYEKGWNGMQALIETDIDSFKNWLDNGNQKGTYKEDGAWTKVYPGISTMVADEREMPEPEQQEMEVLRGKGNNSLPGMGGEFSEVPGGRRKTTIPQSDAGQNRRQQGVLQGKLQVDGLGDSITESQDGSLSDLQGQDDVNATMGRGNGTATAEDKSQNPYISLERGKNTGNSRRNQGKLQNDNISGQNDENGRLGERTQDELQNVKEQDTVGLGNEKDSRDTNEQKSNGNVKTSTQHKRIVSDDQMEELRKKLLEKFNNLNAGIDVERMLLGAMYAVGKIERGVTKFADYAQEMVNEIGDAIRPYLKAFYNAVRDMPEAAPYRDQMDDAQTVEAFDVFNFDKGGKVPDAIVKAEQVVRKQKAGQQVKKIEKEVKQKIQQGDLFAGDLFGDAANMQRTEQKAANMQRTEPGAGMKTAWWQDENRPQGLNPKDYTTYTTDEAKAYFAQFKSEDGKTDFTKWAHPELSFITAAVWDGVEIPYEDLRRLPEIVEAEKAIKDAESNGKLEISNEETEQLAQRLLDQGQAKQERKALFIVGLPAGGKSSVFANPLAKQYGARIIDSDDVKPWLDGYDGGNGAGYVQDASAKVAERAIDLAAQNGDNIIIPRIGGSSVYDLAAALRLAGYDVQLYFNDVKGVTSIDRAASRFAQTGRYLSLDYLTKRAGIPSEKFSNFAEKSIGGYLDERTEEEVQNIRGRLQGLRGELYGSGSGLWESLAAQRRGNEAAQGAVQDSLGSGELQAGGSEVQVLLSEPLFSYVEWKSNDVPIGEKPKEIWNSESGKPMPGKKGVNNDARDLQQVGEENRRGSDRVSSGESSVSRSADDNGLESDLQERRDERQGDTGVSQSDGAVSSSTSGQLRPVQGLTQQQPAQPKQAPKHNNKRNNSGERGKDYAPLSPKARFNANVAAIKMMRELTDQGIEAPTKDQMEVLRQYSGWGGLGTFFNDESSAENKILRDLLDEEEYNAATLSIKTAYYTPAYIIDSLWDIAKKLGFKGGNMLEGSAGIGNIIAQMPRDMSRQSDIEAVEIDKISGNILKLLYPDAKVHIQGFQDTVIRNGSVDLAITNVPFAADISVIDKTDKDLSRRFRQLHDFCIAKNIRKLREGGIGIFITSSGTMDKSTDLRAWISDEGQADVVGAFRLNNETFGGAKVTSDIIVVRKRAAGEAAGTTAIDISKATPLRVGTYEDKYGNEHQVSMVVNDYFKEHPEMMAGEMAFAYEKGDTYRPGSYGLYPVEGKNQEKMLAQFVKGMEGKAEVAVVQQQTEQEPVKNQLTAEKEGRMLIDDQGRLCVSERGVAVPLGLNASKVKGQTKEQCFKDYQAVQKAVDDVLQQQLSSPEDEALKPKLTALNKAYDLFTKRYGTLHKNTAISFLRNDIDFPSFQALEIYKEEKNINGKVSVKTSKPKLFTERVIGFKTEPQPKTVKDAVVASMFRSNGIDLEWIAAKLNEVAAPPHGDKWTTDDVRKGILVSRLGFEDPSTGQLEIRYKYLSGNVREKLAIAEAYNGQDGRYSANIEELRKVVPMDIPAHLIDFSLGSSWIPTEIYRDYLKEVYDLENVKLSHIEGNWVLGEGYGYRNEKNRAAGVYSEQFRETIYGHQLVAAALNNRPVKVQKQVSEGWGSSKTTRTVTDQAATQACAVRVDEIKDEFKQFAKKKMQDDPELAQRIEKIYNDKFNALVPMEVGDEFLPDVFDGANQTLPLYNHQKRGVMRGVIAPTMLAHEVGTGKSFTLITTAMEMRRLGTAKKPMIVVQNATVAQMTADAKLLYPNAKVLSLSEKDRSAEGRRAFYAKIKYNSWDLVIVPQSTFERIPDSPERELQFIQEKIDEKKHVIEAAEQSGMDSREIQRLKKELEKIEQEYGDTFLDGGRDTSTNSTKGKKKDAKREAASLEKAKVKAQEQLDRAVDDVQYFDDLGVDALLVDEAHEYKHLGFQTSIGRGIKGIDPSYSKKCAGLYNKTRSVFEKAGWKNVVFATGTPISNTAAEIWTFMKYLMPADVMKANDIYYFDDFVHNFGSISQMLEFATSGKFKENTRFAAYVNKPELIRIWSQVADTVLTREVGAVNEKIPDEEGGKDQDVFLPQSPSLIRIMNAVRKELERFEQMTGKEKKENSSIPLTMYGIAKRAAIDPRLVDAEAPDEPMSKTNAAVKEIVKDLEATKSYKGTVAVFCDNQNRKGADGSISFNIYDDMKEKLVKAGVPEGQIAIIKSGMSITAKQKVFDAVNSGDIRVVLGSTQTLGTGVNMQERLHLLIHMDAPDRPMDYTQRNGRIKRQGNLHKQWGKTIRVLRFGVEDSLDVTAYQRLKTKSGFIDSIMDGKSALANNQVDRTVEEEEEGLFDNPVAVLSGSQYALKKNQAERELRKYQSKKAQWEADQVYVSNALRYKKRDLEATKSQIAEEEKQLAHIKSLFPNGTVGTITVEGVNIDMSEGDAALGKLTKTIKEKINDPVNATVKKLRENQIYNNEVMPFMIELDGHKVNFTVSVEREAVYENGKMRTVVHKYTTYASPSIGIDALMKSSKSVGDQLNDILDEVVSGRDNQERIEAMQSKIDRINRDNEQLKEREGMEFQFSKELEQARKNVEEYTELMKQEMKEKEAKYAAMQEPAGESAGTEAFDLRKVEESEEEGEDVFYRADEDNVPDIKHRLMEEFAEGQLFEIHSRTDWNSHNVLDSRVSYWTDLMPDEYSSKHQLLDVLRNQYPTYFIDIEDGMVRFESWGHVLRGSGTAAAQPTKATRNYVERKERNAVMAVNDLAQRMGLDVEVLMSTEGLTGKKARSKGWFNPKTGKITIVLPNHRNQGDLINTLLHEGVAHYGLRKLFGQNFDTFLDNVYNNVSPEIRAIIDASVKRNGWSRHEATEEYLARLAERTDFETAERQGWWRKIKELFLQMLSKVGLAGFDETLTDNELRYILWRSYDHLLHPNYRRNVFDTAREIDMRRRLGVERYVRERERLQRTGKTDTSWIVADRVNEEMLNRDIEGMSSQELLLSLSQKEGDERNEAINELVRRVRAGEARVVRLGQEVPLDGASDAQIAGTILGGLWQLKLSQLADETLRSVVPGRPEVDRRSSAQGKDIAADIKLAVVSWAKASGHYLSEEDVKNESLDKDVWRSGAQSRVYRTADGKKVVKFMESYVYYENPLLKNIDGLALQNSVGFEPLTVLGYSLDEFGELQIVLEQSLVDGVTIDDAFDDEGQAKVNDYINRYLENVLGLVRHTNDEGNTFHMKDGLVYDDIHGGNVLMDKNGQLHVIDCYMSRADDNKRERADGFSIEDNEQDLFSIRTKEPPKKTGIGYKVFVLKDGQLYPAMVANPGGEGTPVGVWLDADAAPIAGTSKTGRPQVKAGGKGTQGGSGQLAYRPGWHLGTIPYALQFNRKDENGERTLFPNNFVWAEVEYADDVDYQDEARQEGINANGKYQHSLAGLKHLPTDGSYMYRTNPDPRTDPWIITGSMRVNKILSREEVDELVRKAGREPQPLQDGDVLTQEAVDELNKEIEAMKAADEMGLLFRDDDDVAIDIYEEAVAKESLKWQEAWQDSMASLKAIQDAIAVETGKVATGAEDAYRFENRMHGRAKNMTEQYDWRFYRPMLKAFNDFIKERNLTQEQGMEYLVAKSGLERNVYYAFRDGAKAMIADEVKQEREQLEKDYARQRISEADYLAKKADLAEKERTGVDELMENVRGMFSYQHAKDEYDAGNISYSEYLRIIETVIRGQLKRKKPKKDADGNVVSDNYYDDYDKDWSGLTETFAKELYDDAQAVKKQADREIDKKERRELYRQYDELMRQAYITARQLAEDAVFSAEGDAANMQHTEPFERLWMKINAATKETLRHSYESGLIDKKNYNKVREMFNWYIPLRGWDEDKASDVYTYMGRENVFSPAVKKTWGRQSRAENPLAYIGNIAVSTILSGHRNLLKQHFLNYVLNNPTSLVSISESWYENIGDDDNPVWVLRNADTAGKSADEIAQIVSDFNEEMEQKQRDGKAMPVRGRLRLDVHATSGQKSEHVVEVQRAGRTYQLYINGNPKAAQALNGTNMEESKSRLREVIKKINRSMATFFTSKNPAFVISNLSRDLNMAGASVAVNEGKAYNARFIANVAKVLTPRMGESSKWMPANKQVTGLMPSLLRKWKKGTLNENDETERYFKEFMDEGGETGFVNMLSVDSFKEKMQKEIAEMNGSSLFSLRKSAGHGGVKETSVHKGLRLLGDAFEFYNRCAEDATRFIVYMTSRQMGKTLEESIADAKDVTLNFNRKGTGGKGANWMFFSQRDIQDLFIFVNPAIQALANMYRMATGHPLKFGEVTAAFVAGGALMPVINNWLLNLFGDDDDKQAYWNLPPWVRKNNLVFWIPFTKNFVTIPLAQEFRVFYGVGEMLSSAVKDHPVNNWGLEVFSSVADLVPINPTGNGGNLMVDFAPTMVQPLTQVGENIDFTGKPIWRENQGNKYAPMYTKAYVSTPKWMVKVSETVNDLTGGNEGKKGVVEQYAPVWGDYVNNPAVWNHLLQGYFGGMYNTIAKAFDVGVTAAQGEVPKVYQTPVINRFLNRPVERDNAGVLGEDYYRLTEERDALRYELRTWQKKAEEESSGETAGRSEAQEHVDEILNSREWKRAEIVSHYEEIIKVLKAGERAATESADKYDIKQGISLFKEQMLEELAAVDGGKEPLEAAVEAYGKAKTFAEKNKLRMRIERLMMREGGRDTSTNRKKGRSADVQKALSYITDMEKESRDTNEKYLEMATAENVMDDARIKAAKAKLKPINDEYEQLLADGRGDKAAQYYKKHQKELEAWRRVDELSRAMNANIKLLGKGHDKPILMQIDKQRLWMLKAIEGLKMVE